MQNLAVKIRSIALPERLAGRPVSRKGFPVPYFVAWRSPAGELLFEGQGEPDFRVVDTRKRDRCLRFGLCWLCGKPLGKFKALVVGPMCLVNRTTAEPNCHPDCAEYAARACPFLANDRARRNEAAELPAGAVKHPAGHARNPGVACDFTHRERALRRIPQELDVPPIWRMPAGEPSRLTFFANGERATRREVMDSLESGLVILQTAARVDGRDALAELERLYGATVELVQRWTDEFEGNQAVHHAAP